MVMAKAFFALIPTRLSENNPTSSMLHQYITSVSTLCSPFYGIGQSFKYGTIHTVLGYVKRW